MDLIDLLMSDGTVRLPPAVAGDQVGASRDGPAAERDLEPYPRALEVIDVDPAHLLLVAAAVAVWQGDDDGGRGNGVVATTGLGFLPGLARRGALRAQVERCTWRLLTGPAASGRRWRMGCPPSADEAAPWSS